MRIQDTLRDLATPIEVKSDISSDNTDEEPEKTMPDARESPDKVDNQDSTPPLGIPKLIFKLQPGTRRKLRQQTLANVEEEEGSGSGSLDSLDSSPGNTAGIEARLPSIPTLTAPRLTLPPASQAHDWQ